MIFAAGLNAAMDMNYNQYDFSVFRYWNPEYWNPNVSYKNKYKDPSDLSKGEKFFGSTTFLVFLTDSWHLFKMLFLSTLFLSVILYTPLFTLNSKLLDIVAKFAMYSAVWGIVFETVKKLLRRV